MISETRNQLLAIFYMITKEDGRKRNLDILLESYRRDIENKLSDLENQKRKLENDLDVLEYVKDNLKEW